MSLVEEIGFAKRKVVTDSLSFSVNEIVSMYAEGEINIHPAFQRMFRWGPEQQSDLIESILIGIPLPPFFAFEREDGIWELVDGLQRLSTILKFFGQLKSPEGNIVPASVLRKTRYLPGLDGAVWSASGNNDEHPGLISEIDNSLKLFIKRSRVNVEVLKQPSSEGAKFDLFQRLNRGGSVANEQEVRTCFMVMKNPGFSDIVIELASLDKFKQLCRISDDAMAKQLHIEYMTRLICHTYHDLKDGEDLNEFLDRAINAVMENVPEGSVASHIRSVIDLIFDASGPEALIPNEGRKVFTLRGIESVMVGISRNFAAISSRQNPAETVKQKIENFWKAPENSIFTSSGMSAADRIKKTIPAGQVWFSV
ncbi:DUF262 domain-containing protein [Paracoccus sp. (in: a-proteobacteria)]|uniref:DUF262 domain-containing protein n=1 Tax=Paracoccus sp. TaxID=267 RepID=UPI0035B484B7